ncbi:hypothetical protein GGD41_002722 [Paraburkholderia bryophila]|uniref:Uncharacterized protein n=1 Tax=Paraburkholderia bryophila TaxID=420952 RepID=A0A7Y9W743_9BURK|nr:hypothetical protein [Paraburkholderia bryophila]NYH26198.1 hypothetical protein [Paraburkholderia bryophila]
MTTPLLILLLVLFVGSGGVMLFSLFPRDRGINFSDLDNEGVLPADRSDVLRKPAVFYTATAILVCSAGVYLWWKATAG